MQFLCRYQERRQTPCLIKSSLISTSRCITRSSLLHLRTSRLLSQRLTNGGHQDFDIRFIAIINGVYSDFTPFLNIINEWYAKDASKKIRAVFKAKGEVEKPLCTNPPYSYVKDPDDKRHWIVEETATNVVRRIFNLCVDGYSPSQIAVILKKIKCLYLLLTASHLVSSSCSCS